MHFMDFAKHKVHLGMGITCVWDMGGMLRQGTILKLLIDQGPIVKAPHTQVHALVDTQPKFDTQPIIMTTLIVVELCLMNFENKHPPKYIVIVKIEL